MPTRRDFLALAAVVLVPARYSAGGPRSRQPRDEKLATVTLVIDGMT